jgi:hypothetical protein
MPGSPGMPLAVDNRKHSKKNNFCSLRLVKENPPQHVLAIWTRSRSLLANRCGEGGLLAFALGLAISPDNTTLLC